MINTKSQLTSKEELIKVFTEDRTKGKEKVRYMVLKRDNYCG